MKALKTLLFTGTFFLTISATAQKQTMHYGQAWMGYMTSVKLTPKIAIWNDVHFDTESFFIARHGISYTPLKNATFTGGYAWLFLTTPNSTSLTRKEHRPWAQLALTMPMEKGWTVQNRIRYDARFRQKLLNGDVTDGYTFNHRLRYLFNIRKNVNMNLFGDARKFVSLNDEILLNFGKNITGNNLDQNRASLFFGVSKGDHTFQLGYMHRYVPPASGNLNKQYHTVVLWVNSNFETRKYKRDHGS
ncbi:DUF2490 domain-containing protein [Niabella aquatica]